MSESNPTPAELAAFTRRTSQNPPELEALNESIVGQLRANDGAVVDGPMAGFPLLVLRSTGAKSGRPRVNPLYYLDREGHWYVVGSYAGLDKDPAWVHNLRANPSAQIEIGAALHEVTARELVGSERDRLWTVLLASNPTFAEYEKTITRVMPVFELMR
jgi:deazaflavin-dependent oxidoreductase (nitroreductase family)